jgi:hypothetical protein
LNVSSANESEVHCEYNDNKGYVVFSAMGSFFVPLTVMLYVYARISCVIAQRHDNLEALNNSAPQVKWPLNPPVSITHQSESEKRYINPPTSTFENSIRSFYLSLSV